MTTTSSTTIAGPVAAMAAAGFMPGNPLGSLARQLAVDALCADAWPCPSCGRTGRHHLTFVARDGSGRWRSVAFCDCGTPEDLT